MAENKTRPTGASVTAFIRSIEDPVRRRDCIELKKLMRAVTGKPPRMWGDNIIGFGRYRYRYASGHGGEFFLSGFSPRKQNLTVYVIPGFSRYADELQRLGPHKKGKSCLYLKGLEGIDQGTLRSMIEDSVHYLRENYDCA